MHQLGPEFWKVSNFGGFEFVPKKTEPNSVPIFGQAPEKTSASTGYGTYMQTIIMKDLKTELCNQSFNNRITSADKISFKMLLKHLFTTFLLASGLRSKNPVDQDFSPLTIIIIIDLNLYYKWYVQIFL